jgi:AAA+ superfamily predicted ATPase
VSEAFTSELARLVAAGYPIIQVVTHEEMRALQLVQAAVPGAKLPVWSATRSADPGSPEGSALGAVRHALRAPEGGVFVMLDLHPFLADPLVVRALRDFVNEAARSRRTIVSLGPVASLPVDLEKDAAVLDLPLPSGDELTRILRAEVDARGSGSASGPAPRTPADAAHPAWDWERLVRAAHGLTAAEARRAFRLALGLPDGAAAAARVIAEKRRAMRRSAALELVEAEIGPGDVGGLEVIKGWLKTRVQAFGAEARRFGLPEPRGMLICGVQGCGKSLVTKAASSVFGIPLVRLDFATVFAAPSPEAALREATRVTSAIAPVVLWVDEIEKGLASDGDATHARVFGDFLTWLQEKKEPVFVAATANEVERLPPELARRGRFDEIFFVDLPGAREREDILGIHLRARKRDPARYALSQLAKGLDNYSGAELEQVVISALFRAFTARREVNDEDLRLAAGELVPLATMYEEKVQALRTWARSRARKASADRRTLELFED